MKKTNINTILKDGIKTTVETIDYSTEVKKEELRNMKVKSETSLSNKYVNQSRLSSMIIKPKK